MYHNEPGSLENTAVGRYLLLQLIGHGAFAEVYRARDTNLDRDVAIKAFDPRFSATAELREQILQEARLHARLEHANVVRIYDMVDHDAQFFLVMRYLQGMSRCTGFAPMNGRHSGSSNRGCRLHGKCTPSTASPYRSTASSAAWLHLPRLGILATPEW